MMGDEPREAAPDSFVRKVGEQIAFASDGTELAWKIEAALCAILTNADFIRSGASRHLVDVVVARFGQAIEPLQRHYGPEPAGEELDVGLRCASMIVRSYGLSPSHDEMPSEFDIGMWFGSVAHLRNSMLNDVIFRRLKNLVAESGQLGRADLIAPPVRPSTIH